MRGYDAIRSANASKPSGYILSSRSHKKVTDHLTLIFRYVPSTAFGHTLAGEIAAHDKDLREPVVLDAIVKQLTYSGHRPRVIQPQVGQEEER